MTHTFFYYVRSGAKFEDAPWISFEEEISEEEHSLILTAKEEEYGTTDFYNDEDGTVDLGEIIGLEDLYKSIYQSVLENEIENIDDLIDDDDIIDYLESNYEADYTESEEDDEEALDKYSEETIKKAKIEYFKDYYSICIMC